MNMYSRTLILIVIVATSFSGVLAGCVEGYQSPDVVRHYKNGSYIGKSIESSPGNFRHYSADGKFTGTSRRTQ